MWTIILLSLPVLALVDVVVVWVARRQATAAIAAGEAQDVVVTKIGRIMSMFLSGLFVALFVVYYLLIRNPWPAFGVALVVGMLNTLIAFLIYALMGRR